MGNSKSGDGRPAGSFDGLRGEAGAGGFAILASVASGRACLTVIDPAANRRPRRLRTLSEGPDGQPRLTHLMLPPGASPVEAVERVTAPSWREPEDPRELIEELSGGALGTPSLADSLRKAGIDDAAAAALVAEIPDLMELAGFSVPFRRSMEAIGGLTHTSAEQRRHIFSPQGDGIREFACTYPYLADAHWPEVMEAIQDGADPIARIAAANADEDGRAIPASTLRRFRGIPAREFITGNLTPSPSNLLGLLAAIPPDWFPADREQRRSFSDLSDALPRMMRRAGVSLSTLVSSSKGDWVGLRDRCIALSPPGQPSALRLMNILQDIEDFPSHFADKVVLPLTVRSGIDATPERLRIHAKRLAMRSLYSGRTAIGILEASRRWHGQVNRIDAEIPGLSDPDAPWTPLAEPYRYKDVLVVPLCTDATIVEEGAPGPDRAGVPGLGHCVASYRANARAGRIHILSVRRILSGGGYERLATAEVTLVDSGRIRVDQIKGRLNAEPPVEARAAVEAFARDVRSTVEYVPDGTRDPVEAICGYDWRNEASLAAALSAFVPVLPRGLRNMTPDDLARSLGLPEPESVPSPRH